jgi:hypothetical protein
MPEELTPELQKIVDWIKAMTNEEVAALMDEIRRRQQTGPTTCDACRKELPPDASVYDVAVSITTSELMRAEQDEFDPQGEGYLCADCWFTIPLNIRKALT